MKRWMVLLIIFAFMGGWIVLSGCTDGNVSDEDLAACDENAISCTTCTGEVIANCVSSGVKSCWETCLDCSWIYNIECTGGPNQWCVNCGSAFTDACNERHMENMKGQ